MQISLLLHIITALYVTEIWLLSELSNKKIVREFSLKRLDLQFDGSSNILICTKNSVYNVHSCCTFRLLDYFAHKFALGLSTQRVTCYFRNRSYAHDFLRVKFFGTKFLHTRLFVGVFLCLKIRSWKEMNRVIFLWMLLFFCPSFSA